MQTETHTRDSWQVISIKEDTSSSTTLTQLPQLVRAAYDSGCDQVAVAFTPRSFLTSRALGNLAACAKYARDKGLTFGLISANQDMTDLLELTGISPLLRVCASVEELSAG